MKSWKYPETETADAYTTGLFNSLTSFAAIKMWSFAAIAFPVYLVMINSSLILAIYRKRVFKKEFAAKPQWQKLRFATGQGKTTTARPTCPPKR